MGLALRLPTESSIPMRAAHTVTTTHRRAGRTRVAGLLIAGLTAFLEKRPAKFKGK